MAEFDVKLSADGVAFLLHDDTLDRTTDVRGRADALTWRELSLLDAGSWHSPAYAGEPLATLAGVAAWSRAHDVAVNIEIKPTRGRERETGAAVAPRRRNALVGRRCQAAPLLVFRFFIGRRPRGGSRVARAYLGEQLPDDWRERVMRLGCIALDLKHTLLSQARIEEIHSAGLRIATWTVNDPARAADLLAWGVDTLITDAVDLIGKSRSEI